MKTKIFKPGIFLGLGVAIIDHAILVFENAIPSAFWLVSNDTAIISAALEIVFAGPIIFAIGFWKTLGYLHDRPKVMRDFFSDEGQLQ